MLIRHRCLLAVPRVSLKYPQRLWYSVLAELKQDELESPVDILLAKILEDPILVRDSLLELKSTHGTEEFENKVVHVVENQLQNDPFRSSLFQCTIGSLKLSDYLNRYLEQIIQDRQITHLQKFNLLWKYLHILNKLIPANVFEPKLIFNTQVLQFLASSTPREHYKELFVLLLNLNYEFHDQDLFTKVIYSLKEGSGDDYYVFLNAKLRGQESKTDTDLLMIHNYTFGMFAGLLRIYTRLKNSQEFTKVLSLIFKKIEITKDDDRKKLYVSRAYELMMSHILLKYDLKPALLLLQDMKNNDIPMSNRMLMIILSKLAFENDLQNFAIMTNYVLSFYKSRSETMDYATVLLINNQMLKVIQGSSYTSSELKVIMGYMLSFYEQSESLLARLGLLSLAYGDEEGVQKDEAFVSEDLGVLKYPPISSLEQTYKACFKNLNLNNRLSLNKLKELYFDFRDTVLEVQNLDSSIENYRDHPFNKENLNYKILKLFMDECVNTFDSYEGAEEILDDFTSQIKFSVLPNSRIFDMIISYHVRCGQFSKAFKWFERMTKQYNIKLNFRPLINLIIESHDLGSDIGREISRKLIVEHYAPLVLSNVTTKFVTPRMKYIILDLGLLHVIDPTLPETRQSHELRPGVTEKSVLNLEEEFGGEVIDLLEGQFAKELKGTSLNGVPKMKEAEEYDDEETEIFDASDMENEAESDKSVKVIVTRDDQIEQPQISRSFKADTKFIDAESLRFKQKTERSLESDSIEIETPDDFDSLSSPNTAKSANKHPNIIEDTPGFDPLQVVQDLRSMGVPSEGGALMIMRRKEFLKMLQSASNSDLVSLMIKFFDQNKKHIIFYKDNKNYRRFHVSRRKRQGKLRAPYKQIPN